MATQEVIARGNHRFFIVDFSQNLFSPNSQIESAIWKSLWESSTLCAIPGSGDICHYLRTTLSFSVEDPKVSAEVSRFKKDFSSVGIVQKLPEYLYMNRWSGKNNEVVIQMDYWIFDFRIVEYERDSSHGFVRIKCPWEDPSILDDEDLNRITELHISPS
ncbi:MAG: hypothetical protein EOM19_00375 [Candidatus Moranbacteria bacterium]|nr:hypothetical protein [Candidatus Moranbacteria bacterium]